MIRISLSRTVAPHSKPNHLTNHPTNHVASPLRIHLKNKQWLGCWGQTSAPACGWLLAGWCRGAARTQSHQLVGHWLGPGGPTLCAWQLVGRLLGLPQLAGCLLARTNQLMLPCAPTLLCFLCFLYSYTSMYFLYFLYFQYFNTFN